MSGVLLVDKPDGPTSHDVVRWARKVFQTRSVGHAGTLDPMATGVLVVAVGEATKLVPYLTADDKRYEAEITFGSETDTLDARGVVTKEAPVPELSEARVREALSSFAPGYMQRAPAVSALKKDGRSLHARVRAGEIGDPPVRFVEVRSLELRTLSPDRAVIEVHSGKGFYVRSLARDLAEKLGTLGHLSALRRTFSGEFPVSRCVDGERLRAAMSAPELAGEIRKELLTLTEATRELPTLTLTEAGERHAACGRPVPSSDCELTTELPTAGTIVRLLSSAGKLVAMATWTEDEHAKIMRGFHDV